MSSVGAGESRQLRESCDVIGRENVAARSVISPQSAPQANALWAPSEHYRYRLDLDIDLSKERCRLTGRAMIDDSWMPSIKDT
jgi:hypothetical protein